MHNRDNVTVRYAGRYIKKKGMNEQRTISETLNIVSAMWGAALPSNRLHLPVHTVHRTQILELLNEFIVRLHGFLQVFERDSRLLN